MKATPLALCLALLGANDAFAQARHPFAQHQFEGAAAREAVCSFLLHERQRAESDGRLDFSATVESIGTDASPTLIAFISPGPAYAVRQIRFSGHRHINDTTLRRTLKSSEREMLNIHHLRRGLAAINQLGRFQPLSINDVIVTRLDDGVSVDLTIQLRERKPRWWSISGLLLPGSNPWKASIASRLPPWGRGFFEMATYFVSLNAVGFGVPFLALERPLIPGQEWLSGFAITPALSPRTTAMHYAQSHALLAASSILDRDSDDPFVVDIASEGTPSPASLACKAPRPRFWWLRLAARQMIAIYG